MLSYRIDIFFLGITVTTTCAFDRHTILNARYTTVCVYCISETPSQYIIVNAAYNINIGIIIIICSSVLRHRACIYYYFTACVRVKQMYYYSRPGVISLYDWLKSRVRFRSSLTLHCTVCVRNYFLLDQSTAVIRNFVLKVHVHCAYCAIVLY